MSSIAELSIKLVMLNLKSTGATTLYLGNLCVGEGVTVVKAIIENIVGVAAYTLKLVTNTGSIEDIKYVYNEFTLSHELKQLIN